MSQGAPVRLLLVEFAVVSRFHRAMSFPQIQGFARRRGARVLWLRFAVEADIAQRLGSDGASLPDEDQAVLRRHVREFNPSHLLFGHRPAASLVGAAEPGDGSLKCAYLRAAGPEPGEKPDGLLSGLSGEPAIVSFLGCPESANLEQAPPDYAWVAGNRAAETLESLPFVSVDAECRYNKSLAENSFFKNVDLSASLRPGGCSFCLRPKQTPNRSKDLAALLEEHLSAVEKTCPRLPGRRLAIRLTGESAMRRIDETAELITRLALRPAEFLLDSRTDLLLKTAAKFEKALERLKGTGHRFALALIGIENFASSELRRYNKGLSPIQNLEVVKALFDWEARFPEVFSFREHGGLSMISFNPWTRPEEFDLNVTVADLTGIGPVMGKLWDSRLRLYPGLALEARARKDGLLIERCEDPLLETARRNFYEDETPWRFLSPEMEGINRILTRFFIEGAPPQDPLSAEVSAFLKECLGLGLSHSDAAHLVVLAAQRAAWEGRPSDPIDALARAGAMAGSHPRINSENTEWIRPDSLSKKKAAELLAKKPVVKVEPIHTDDLPAWRARRDLPHARFYKRSWANPLQAPAWEMFYGRKLKDVRRAVDLTGRETAAPGPKSRAVTRAVGLLLGYPTCCSTAHSLRPAATRHWYFWGHVANRLAADGPVPWELNPALRGVEHVPCSLACAPSLARARRALSGRQPPAGRRNPVLMLWGADDCWVELIAQTPPGPRFRYRAGGFSGKGPDLEAVQEGTEIEFAEETVLILKGSRPFASLSARAFLWWHKKVFQAEFWRAILAARRAAPYQKESVALIPDKSPSPNEGPAAEPKNNPGPPERPPAGSPSLASLLARVDAECAGKRPDGCKSSYDGDVITVSFDGKEIGLFLAPRKRYQGPFFAEMPSFYACIRGDSAMTPREGERLGTYVKALTRRDAELKELFQA